MALGGAILRILQMCIRAIQLLASILVLGVFSYFLAILADHHLQIQTWIKAVEGMSGAAVLYTAFAVVLTICLGGVSFFAFLAIVLDLCFVGCFAAIAVLNRGGAHSCSGNVNTPLGSGPSDSSSPGYGQNGFGFGSGENVTYFPNLHRACMLEKAVFAVAIINGVLFLVSAVIQLLMAKHHRKEKRYGPSPANNYTSGPGRRPFWRRKNRATRDAEIGAVGAGALAADKHHHDHMRPSHETAYTGTTVDAGGVDAYGHTKYANEPVTYGQTQGVTRTNANF